MRKHILIPFFVLLWFLYGTATNLWDQYGYNLMHAGVEALAERGRFFLGGSRTPKFVEIENTPPVVGEHVSTDTFEYRGRLYPVKQPGMFFVGAIFYKPLSVLKITYDREYNLATALVSWLTSGLFAALCVTLILSQGLQEGLKIRIALVPALSLGLGSIFFPYSGILHHDLLSGCFLYFSYYLVFVGQGGKKASPVRILGAGFLAGFSFATSTLTIAFLIPFVIALTLEKGGKRALVFAGGALLGMIPMFVYNAACFGNPFLLANRAAGDATTQPGFSAGRFAEKFHWYFISPKTALWTFSPIMLFALAGLFVRARKQKKEGVFLAGGSLLLIFLVFSIPTHGGAAFGPRYLLCGLPFFTVGLISLFKQLYSEGRERKTGFRLFLWICLGVFFSLGIVICFTGAIRGTMHGMEEHPFLYRLKSGMGLSVSRETPAPFPLFYPLIFILSLLFYFVPDKHRD